jgi:uncharacterized membrane protein
MLYRIVTLTALALGGALLAKKFNRARGDQASSSIREEIDVGVPVRVAYDQFTRFAQFPRFMDGVRELRQLDEHRWHWRALVAGKEVEWEAEITEQLADTRIAWRSTSGTPNGGTVAFRSLSRARTRITLEMYAEPQDGAGSAADALDARRVQARASLKQFKEMIELPGQETSAWRNTVAAQPEAGPGS